jgi:hypothetical protein
MAYKKRTAKFTPVNEEQEQALETIVRIARENNIELVTITDSDFAEAFAEAFALFEESTEKKLKAKMTVGACEDYKNFVLRRMENIYSDSSKEFFVHFTYPSWGALKKR